MGRLAGILAKANEAVAGVEDAVERDVMNIIDRAGEVHKVRERVMLQKHMAMDGQVSDLKEFVADLEDFGKNDKAGASGGDKPANAYTGTAPPKL